MESKHTAGEWTIENGIQLNITQGKRGFVIANITTQATQFIGNREEAEANAKLISCAPDMAKMLSGEIKLLDRFMKMLPGKGIMWHEMKERKKFIKIVLDKATF